MPHFFDTLADGFGCASWRARKRRPPGSRRPLAHPARQHRGHRLFFIPVYHPEVMLPLNRSLASRVQEIRMQGLVGGPDFLLPLGRIGVRVYQ
jgi:hypothetical protein